ncbi:MAG: dynamin family protein [Elainellaceae cyanobacterium]
MSRPVINRQLQQYRQRLDVLLQDLQTLAIALENGELQGTVKGLQQTISEPFLFVVVGEVKAGKSSFVNALLEAEVCGTDIEPCTDTVQQIIYSDEPFETSVGERLKKIGRPIEILKDISIVDTPGTNTIVEQHQTITESYIPNSDLVFFVFFAKNPYQQSTWTLLDYVNADWRKKVVFILQQADLVKPDDLLRNVERVKDLARQKQIAEPTVFATSAEQEQEGDSDRSGFVAVRDYIHRMVTSGESYRLKLSSTSRTADRIVERLAEDVALLKEQLVRDERAVETIHSKIETAKARSLYEVESLADRLLARYDRIAVRIKQDFRDSFSVLMLTKRSFLGIFNKNQSIQAWVDEFKTYCQQQLSSSLEETSNEGAKHFMDGIYQLLDGLAQELDELQTRQKLVGDRITIKVLERRQEVIEDIRRKLDDLLTDERMINALVSDADDIAVEIVGGAFAAVAGVILHAIEFAIGEVILNAIGIAFAGVGVLVLGMGLLWQRNQVIRKFERALDNERSKFKDDIYDRLTAKLNVVYEEIERLFVPFFEDVKQEKAAVEPIKAQYEAVKASAEELDKSSVKVT